MMMAKAQWATMMAMARRATTTMATARRATTTMATARRAMTWQDMTKTTTATGDEDKDGGDGATGDKIDDDGDGATGDGATGYDDNDDDGGGTTGDEVDEYDEGRTGDNDDDDDDDDDDNGDGTERHNNQIEVAGGFASRASWQFASRFRCHAWPSRARQFTPRHPRCACQLAQHCHRRARRQFARLMLPSPCMLATCPPSPFPRVAIASTVIHPPSPSPRVTATRPTSPSPAQVIRPSSHLLWRQQQRQGPRTTPCLGER